MSSYFLGLFILSLILSYFLIVENNNLYTFNESNQDNLFQFYSPSTTVTFENNTIQSYLPFQSNNLNGLIIVGLADYNYIKSLIENEPGQSSVDLIYILDKNKNKKYAILCMWHSEYLETSAGPYNELLLATFVKSKVMNKGNNEFYHLNCDIVNGQLNSFCPVTALLIDKSLKIKTFKTIVNNKVTQYVGREYLGCDKYLKEINYENHKLSHQIEVSIKEKDKTLYQMICTVDASVTSLLIDLFKIIKALGIKNSFYLLFKYIFNEPLIYIPIIGTRGITRNKDFHQIDPFCLGIIKLKYFLFNDVFNSPEKIKMVMNEEYYKLFNFKPISVLEIFNSKMVYLSATNNKLD
ncbi:hypothetical protein ABK040_016260 [Willaertia magna]